MDTGESDRVLTILSLEEGKLDLTARGARKSGSRNAGMTEPLSVISCAIAQTKRTRYLGQTESIQANYAIRKDYDKLNSALVLAESLEAALPWHKPVPEVFGLFLLALEQLSLSEHPLAVQAWAEVWLLRSLGYGFDFLNCQGTGEKLREDPAHLSAMAGGYVHSSIARQYPDVFYVPSKVAYTLGKLGEVEQPPAQIKQAEAVVLALGNLWRDITEGTLLARMRQEEELRQILVQSGPGSAR